MSDEMTTHERLAAWLDGEAALYRERAQRAEDAQDWDPAVRYAGAADALVQLRDRVLLGEQIGPAPARQGRCRPGQNGGLAAIFGQWPGDETEAREYRRPAALLRTPRGEGCRMVDETYCATHDCGAHDDEKCGRPGCQHCDAQTVGDRHRLSRHLLALASVIEDGGKPSNSVADDVRRAASALVYTPPPHAMRQVTDRLASLLDADADWLHDEALAGRLPDRCQAVAERIRAALRSDTAETPRGEGERGLIMRAMLETFPWSPDIRQEHFERAADAVIAALRSEAQEEGWQVTEPTRDIVRREMSETRATVREAIRAARRGEGGGDGE